MLDNLLTTMPPGSRPSKSTVVDRLYSLIVVGSGSPDDGRQASYLLFSDNAVLVATVDPADIAPIFSSQAELYVAEHTTKRVFVHAGAVGWNGRAILVPGRSNTGKSTLVAELVKAGATYYSDDYAVLDMQGRLHPYPRPLSLRETPTSVPTKVPIEELGGKTGKSPIPVALVVAGGYKQGANWKPKKLSAGAGALELLANTVSAQKSPEIMMPVLQQVVGTAAVYKGARGDAAQIARRILALAEKQDASIRY